MAGDRNTRHNSRVGAGSQPVDRNCCYPVRRRRENFENWREDFGDCWEDYMDWANRDRMIRGLRQRGDRKRGGRKRDNRSPVGIGGGRSRKGLPLSGQAEYIWSFSCGVEGLKALPKYSTFSFLSVTGSLYPRYSIVIEKCAQCLIPATPPGVHRRLIYLLIL
jgi:hypothetical protein